MPRIQEDLLDRMEELHESERDVIQYLVNQLAPGVPSKRARKSILLSLASPLDKEGDKTRTRIHTLLIGNPSRNELLRWVLQNLEYVGEIPSPNSDVSSFASLKQLCKKDPKPVLIRNLEAHSPDVHSMAGTIMTNEELHNTPDHKANTKPPVIASAKDTTKLPPELLNEFDFIIRIYRPDKQEEFDSSRERQRAFFDSISSDDQGDDDPNLLCSYLRWVRSYQPRTGESVFTDIENVNKRLIASNKSGVSQIQDQYLRTAYTLARIERGPLEVSHYFKAIAIHEEQTAEEIRSRYDRDEPVTLATPSPLIDNTSQIISRILELDSEEFEVLVAEIWEHRGWTTKLTEQQDRGIDVVALKHEPYPEKELIQVKQYDEQNPVSSEEVQQYASLKIQQKDADKAIIVTTSDFTDDACKLAEDLNVKLVNGTTLSNIINDINYTSRII